MINQFTNINKQSTSQTIEQAEMETFMNQQPNKAKLVVLNLNDLNADILSMLKARQCNMVLLNENFKIVEEVADEVKTIQQLALTINGEKQVVAIQQIIRFEASGNYTNNYLKNKAKPVLTSKTLKYYAKRLDDTTFLRPHQSHLVNSAFVEELVLKPVAHLILKDGNQIHISRRKRKMFSK